MPAHNEMANIGLAIDEAIRVGELVADDLEIVIVDDGSHDDTPRIVTEKSAQNSRVRLISHPTNLGYGQAVWTGLTQATKAWVFFTDSDNQFYLDELVSFVDLQTRQGVPIVIGWRRDRRDGWRRRLNGYLWTKYSGRALGFSCRDVDCAFKLIRRDCLDGLEIKSGGAAFSAELLWRLQQSGHRWLELPVSHRSRKGGAQSGSKLKVIKRAFAELAVLRNER